ncbi:aspartyl protease [Winogradskyella pacifica]|uniref:Aspartyl protease n=1 Tax=Winogradskyella pacifica TaxID=664642 RepID=A0A3D9N416_9FLAO|nr:aspartyl protease family protein [Winogradskyella pacifica]REE25714.1 aspartyl protease [Winogradskyella pacifica]
MTKNNFILFFIAINFLSCSSLKRLKTVTQGKVEQENYTEEIPFKFVKNQIIIEVEINNKNYSFIFDTGNELTTIDPNIINEISYKSNNVKGRISDANKTITSNEYLSISNIKIGKIDFKNIGAYSSDFTHYYQFLGPDTYYGIIGNNLMRKAKWQIDYKNKVIRISDKIDNFNIGGNSKIFKTNSGKYGNAKIKIKLNGIEDSYTFDTGFSGNISANLSLFNKLNSKKNIPYVTTTGLTSVNANGITKSTKYNSLLSIQLLNDIKLSNQIVTFKENASNLIGNTFFEKFTITLDWANEIFYLDQNSDFNEDILTEHQIFFHPNYEQNTIIIYSYEDNYLLDKPIELGTQIIAINGINVSNFNTQELYDYWTNNRFTKNVEIEIEEKGLKRKITLTEKQLLPK